MQRRQDCRTRQRDARGASGAQITTKETTPWFLGVGRKAKKEQAGRAGRSPRQRKLPDSAADGRRRFRTRAKGPFDVSEIDSQDGYVDLGALLIAPREGLQLRLEVEEATQRVVAVTMDLDGSSLQLQAFAAPVRGAVGRNPRADRPVRRQPGRPGRGNRGRLRHRTRRQASCRRARTAARATGWPASSASTARAGSSAASSAARQHWTGRPPRRSKTCSARSWWSAATTPCRRGTCCSCACPRTPAATPPPAGPGLRAARTRTGDHPDWLMPARQRTRRTPVSGQRSCRTGAGCCATASLNR